MKRLLATLLIALLIALPATAKNTYQPIMAITEVATGAPVTVTITNGDHRTGYLVIKTENETATASMVVTVYNTTVLGDFLVCTTLAITTNTTTVALLGSEVAAADGITTACDFPLGQQVKYVFTTSGAGADFDVTAHMQWITE